MNWKRIENTTVAILVEKTMQYCWSTLWYGYASAPLCGHIISNRLPLWGASGQAYKKARQRLITICQKKAITHDHCLSNVLDFSMMELMHAWSMMKLQSWDRWEWLNLWGLLLLTNYLDQPLEELSYGLTRYPTSASLYFWEGGG